MFINSSKQYFFGFFKNDFSGRVTQEVFEKKIFVSFNYQDQIKLNQTPIFSSVVCGYLWNECFVFHSVSAEKTYLQSSMFRRNLMLILENLRRCHLHWYSNFRVVLVLRMHINLEQKIKVNPGKVKLSRLSTLCF